MNNVDASIISKLISPQPGVRLIWDPIKPYIKDKKGTLRKNQYWEKKDIDWVKHLSGELKQGGNLANNGKASALVVDIDQDVTAKQICEEAFKVDNEIVCIPSPSKRWHLWKFFREPQPLKKVAAEAKRLERIFKKKKYDVDEGKTNPIPTGGQIGINFPYGQPHQQPHDARGVPLTWTQFLHRLKFQKHPLIAAAAGLCEPGRHTALVKCAAYLEQRNMMTELDAVIANFGEPFDDEKYIERIKEKKIHEKYKNIGRNGISAAISDMVGFEYELPAEDHNVEELELDEYTGEEELQPRPWVVHGWILKKALTLIAGQPGIGKTMLLHMMAWCLATGHKLLGKEILEPGNVLILCPEETKNEIRIRLKGMSQFIGKFTGKNKIFIRGLEEAIKLVKFGLTDPSPTEEYHRLKKALRVYDVKYIILDPLISFQTGNYDENSNQKMEQYIKDYLIPLAVAIDGAIITGHHTNKLSMVSIVDKELLVDHQNAMFSARGASALVAAARFVLGMQPMTRRLWDEYFKDHVTDGSTFIHYTGLIEAKSNYNIVEDDISWLRKNSEQITTAKGKSEKTGVFSLTDFNKITKAKNKLKAAKNEEYARAHLSVVRKLMEDKGEDIITLHSAVLAILPDDDRVADESIKEETIKTSIRRKMENGLHGKVKDAKKGGMTQEGIEADDGYNYWIKRDHSKDGAAKVFIERGKNWKK